MSRTNSSVEDLVAVTLDEKVPAEAAKEPEVNRLFRMAMKFEASDLHLKVGQPPMMRLRGDIRRTEMRPLTQEDMERLFAGIELDLVNGNSRSVSGGVTAC